MLGHVHLHTTSAIKYTCIKIRFIGHISTKIAKAEEGIYVQNQQVVLIGNANNTAESQLEEGKYSWPFEFTFPLQHLPSSGKYRHGSVKYMLVASMTATGFLGSMQEHKTTQQVQLKDLINIQAEPYSDSLLVESSVKTKAQSTRTKDFASVKVQLARSAFLRGQQLSVVIDISHPRKIRRSPGCWVQLIRKEHYYAGEYVNLMNLIARTWAILIEYYLNIILDLRESTGFMERGFNRKLKAAQKEKLLGCPGGAEIQVPVIIGTLSDLLHTHKPSPFTLVTDTLSESVWSQNSTPTVSPTTSPSLAASSAMAATSKPNVNNSFSSFDVYPTHSPYNATCSSNERSSHTQALTQQQIMATFGRTEGSFSNPSNPNLPSGEPPRYTQGPTQATPLTLNTLLTTAADQTDSTDVDTANRNRLEWITLASTHPPTGDSASIRNNLLSITVKSSTGVISAAWKLDGETIALAPPTPTAALATVSFITTKWIEVSVPTSNGSSRTSACTVIYTTTSNKTLNDKSSVHQQSTPWT
ncbi:hypothetical protein BGW38_007418 [Lunasporangiospora selenospora]|uniref:Arrestin-like N-terminal domain-containing protein n=1 Tax=Lunasporangiospora selenospora TaxID=979761 RepID=A0A9P6KIS8_9FUNG|nr:hypothetical protein BGW38_007418 [Lunasporangiospora selenospora]